VASPARVDHWFRRLQLVSAALFSLNHGANDAQKTMGIMAGVLATAAVMAHEIPHEVGDFMILLNAGFTRRRAFVFNLISGSSAVAGGVVGYFVLEAMSELLPYALLLSAASFVYIALSDLLPEMMRRSRLAESLPQVALVLAGVAIAALIGAAMHSH
jgi:zinc and cadmium transporter